MALIKCPECGKEISEFAAHCINCGCPMSKIKEIISKSKVDPFLQSKNIKSEAYLKLGNEQKSVLSKIMDFIEKNTKLIFIQHAVRFGYRKPKYHSMAIRFHVSDGVLYISFKPRQKQSYVKLKLVEKNIDIIQEGILDAFVKFPKEITKAILENDIIISEPPSKKYIQLKGSFYNTLTITNRFTVYDCVQTFLKTLPEYDVKEQDTSIVFVSKNKEWPIFYLRLKNYRLVLSYAAKNNQNDLIDIEANINSQQSIANAVKLVFNSFIPVQDSLNLTKQPNKEKTYFSSSQEELIKTFNTKINEKYPNIICKKSPSLYCYKFEGEKVNAFWFVLGSKKLIFKYRLNSKSGRNEKINAVIASDDAIQRLLAIVDKIANSPLNDSKVDIHLLPIAKQIIEGIKRGKVPNKEPYSELALAIVEYTTNAIFQKYKDLKRFNTREEFDTFKNRYSDYTYHGKRFSFKYPTESDAVFIFEYYIASRLVGVVQSYERIVGKIIEDYNALLDSYYQLINKRSDSYRDVNGVNSNIASIPLEVFEKEVEKYYI